MRAIGLMSGTSLDGVDAAVIVTDGDGDVTFEKAAYVPFDADVRQRLQAIARGDVTLTEVLRAERMLMAHYVKAVDALDVDLSTVDVIGGHGQTIRHLPQEGLTWQLADASYLAEKTGVDVVMDFRRRDMAAGGEGAPFAPLYHRMLLAGKGLHEAGVLNLGGVGNVTWFNAKANTVLGTDTGPACGLLDMFVQQYTDLAYDEGGKLAATGHVDENIVQQALATIAFWQRPLPRSADRYDFDAIMPMLAGFSVPDVCATLVAITAEAVAVTLKAWGVAGPLYVVGGGAKNPALMAGLSARLSGLGVTVDVGEAIGLRGATMEAECFAWLAVRRMRGLSTSLPSVTHAVYETVGGALCYGKKPVRLFE